MEPFSLGHLGQLFAIGALTGVLSGLLGGGGGVITNPLIWSVFSRAGIPEAIVIHVAFGSTLATMALATAAGTLAHSRHRNVWWDVVRVMAVGGVAGSVLGVTAAAHLHGEVLRRAFGWLQLLAAVEMLRPGLGGQGGGVPIKSWKATLPTGMVIGFASSFLGIGGGAVAVPLMAVGLRFPMPVVAGTSGALMMITAGVGTLGYVYYGWGHAEVLPHSVGFVDLVAVVTLSITGIGFSVLGANLVPRVNRLLLSRIFGALLIASGIKLAFF